MTPKEKIIGSFWGFFTIKSKTAAHAMVMSFTVLMVKLLKKKLVHPSVMTKREFAEMLKSERIYLDTHKHLLIFTTDKHPFIRLIDVSDSNIDTSKWKGSIGIRYAMAWGRDHVDTGLDFDAVFSDDEIIKVRCDLKNIGVIAAMTVDYSIIFTMESVVAGRNKMVLETQCAYVHTIRWDSIRYGLGA